MLEHERIREEPCGCRYDVVTKLYVSRCSWPHTRLFPLGRVVATPGAIDALDRAGGRLSTYLERHASGDPGLLSAHDQIANVRAVQDGGRVMSAYTIPGGTTLWVITEADRSLTTLLLPEEY
jgi:hypothetical protein